MSDQNFASCTNKDGGGSNEHSIKERIDSLIKEFFEGNVADKKCNQELSSWRSQDTKLSVSNWSKGKTCDNLQRKIQFLKQTIVKYTETDQIQKQQVENLQMQRSQEEQKDWDGIQSVIAMYDKSFSHGQIEYTTGNLTKHIRSYDQEYTLLCKRIVNMKSKLNNLTMRYNMDSTETDSNLRNLCSIVNGIRSKNTSLLSSIRFADDTLQELRNKLKQTETVLCERKKITENSFSEIFPIGSTNYDTTFQVYKATQRVYLPSVKRKSPR